MALSINKIKEIKSLKEKKFRDEKNIFFIEGKKILQEALKSDWIIKEIILTNENENFINDIQKNKNLNISLCSNKEFERISNDKTPSGYGAIIQKKVLDLEKFYKNKKRYIILDRINDPGNLGTIIRTAAWFGFDKIITTENSCDITNPKVVKATMGALFYCDILENINLISLINNLKEKDIKIIATDTKGKPLKKMEIKDNFAIILGNESHGVEKDIISLCDEIVSIPGNSNIESLNVAISAGIFLYALSLR